MIRDLKAAGSSTRAIAHTLGRSASTISRELGRNTDALMGYLPHEAHRKAAARRPRPKMAKLAGESDLRDSVQGKLLIRWSPEQISNTLVEEGLLGRYQFKEALTSFPPHHAAPTAAASDLSNHAHLRWAPKRLSLAEFAQAAGPRTRPKPLTLAPSTSTSRETTSHSNLRECPIEATGVLER